MRQTPNSEQVPVNIVGSSVFGRYHKISSEKTYNMFESDGWMVNFAGWKRALELLPTGEGRGGFISIRGNFIVAVVNSAVYRINSNLSTILIGNLATFTGEVYIDENLANQVCVVDGVNAYIYNHSLPPSLTIQILNINLIPGYVTYHNSYFLFGNANITNAGSNWYVYLVDTDTTIVEVTNGAIPLQTKPDYAIAIKRIPSQSANILVFGTSVCEIWQNITGPQLYRRNESVNIDYGCLSKTTIASSDQYVVWLGINESNAPAIIVFSNQGAEQISTDGINYVLSNLVEPANSTAMIYRQDGHLFYQITFFNEADNLTLVYDFNTKKFYNLCDTNENYHPAIDVIRFNQKSYFLSKRNASLYEISTNLTSYDENINGEDPDLIGQIPRIRICKSIRHPDASHFRANALYMMIEQGYDQDYVELDDLNPNLHYVPRVDLCLSGDGGVTFGNYVSRYMNPLGKRQNMMTYEKMGAYNDLTMKFKFQGFSHWCVNDAFCEVY